MSRHLLKVTVGGRDAQLTMGWDRPLQGFHCVVMVEGAEFPTYSNLDDPELIESFGLSPELDHLVQRLAELGLSVPAPMLDEIRRDGCTNAGNRLVRWDLQGNQIARA